MKFWKKIFLYSILLFLVVFNGSGIVLIEKIHNDNLEMVLKSVIDKSANIESILYLNLDYLVGIDVNDNESIKHWVEIIINGYSINGSEQYNVELYSNENKQIMSGPNYKIQGKREEILDADKGEKSFIIRKIKNKKYVFVSSIITLENTDLKLIVSKDIDYVYKERLENYRFFSIIDIVMFVVLAIGMFIISKSLTTPLVNLSNISKDIASGDYSKRVIEIKNNDEVGTLESNFNIMINVIEDNIKELKYLNESKQRFIDSLNHEIKTPITSIIGYSELLLKGKVNEETSYKALTYINSEAKRLETLNSTLLKLILIREDKLSMGKVNLKNIISRSYDTLRYKLESKSMNLDIDIDDTYMFVDKQLIIVLLTNIIDNSIKASNEHSSIKINGRYDDKSDYILNIVDFGKGIAECDIDKVLEPFYMSDKARTRNQNGIGLGLSICNEICKLHKIEISIQSEVNVGTSVTLKFNKENIYNED